MPFENPLIRKWNAGQATLNGWLVLPNLHSAEAMAHQGWDSLTIDMQHGMSDYQAAAGMLAAIATTPTVPLARVPWLEEGIIMRMLDAGCHGIICPMINTKADAERLVRACHYVPVGSRSFGPIRAAMVSGADYHETANDEVLAIGMIESRQALDNLDDILSVEEMKAIYIGPADLSLALGCTPKFDQDEPPVVEAIEHIVKSAKAKGKFVGVHNGSVSYARKMIALGADFVSVGSDLRFMTVGASEVVREFRDTEAGESESKCSY